MKQLQLRGKNGIGKITLVDDDAYLELAKKHWYCDYKGYVRGRAGSKLHRIVLKAPARTIVDHINGDRLDNRLSNLRLCTTTQSAQNVGLRKDNTHGYKGVALHKSYQKKGWKCWQAMIKVEGHRKSLGYYATAVEAALAYNEGAKRFYGEFARLNAL